MNIATIQASAAECIGNMKKLGSNSIKDQLKDRYNQAVRNEGIDGLVGSNTLSVLVDIALTMQEEGGTKYTRPENPNT
jgi:hypothetical protein